uniref:Uncharacterized protein n=1 Tax=Hucho hucho TaxID=62062 RepID=A0A4W5KSN6_9TELE
EENKPGEQLNPCRKFQANIFNKSKCQNCFKPRELHLLTDQDLNQVNKCYCDDVATLHFTCYKHLCDNVSIWVSRVCCCCQVDPGVKPQMNIRFG